MRHQLIKILGDLLIESDQLRNNGDFDKSLSLKRKYSQISDKSNLTNEEYFLLNEIYEHYLK